MNTVRLGYYGSVEVAAGLVRRTSATVTLHEYAANDPFRLLRAGELDVMIAKFLVREPDLDRGATLTTDARAVIVGADHPLTARTELRLADLADVDGFACPGTMPAYVWDEVVPAPIRRRYPLESMAAMLALVRSGVAAHLTVASIADLAPPGVRFVPVVDLPAAPVFLTWVSGRLPDHVRDFVRAAESAVAR